MGLRYETVFDKYNFMGSWGEKKSRMGSGKNIRFEGKYFKLLIYFKW